MNYSNDENVRRKPSPPNIIEVTYMSVELNWKEELDKIREKIDAQPNKTNPLAEVIFKKNSSDDWESGYIGYDHRCICKNLEPDTPYYFKIRFKNLKEFENWSDVLHVQTDQLPVTGNEIHAAVRQDNIIRLRELLEKEKASIEVPDNLGFTPLMYCAQRNLSDMMSILLEANASTETETSTGKTAIMFAAFKGNIECMELLLEYGADVHHVDKNGLTALHMAVDGEQPRAIRLLVKSSANLEAVDNNLGWTPLLRCAGLKNNGNVDVARELIKLGANINIQDRDGKTPLHNCILLGHYDLCQLLLENNANMNIKTKNGHNAVELSESIGNQVSDIHHSVNNSSSENRKFKN
ncbi:Fibronectin type 3 and ankyrin repeat-containing 1 protein [Schistosoma japonicum]|uniref:Fibronectin type 3 and ankyrin repeat-containing 1 protein n=1 Tax=Schistosoma japonicum TaxID=6182 RepID=A0A4Z2DUW3_SCHJA|nr:Fibronectin type 3 and ankyrin repeat-containing 1 protein [Schistosoma japonicum]